MPSCRKNEDEGKKQSMKNPPPSLGSPIDPSATQMEKREGEVLNQVKTEMRRCKLVGKKGRTLQTKRIFKKLRKVQKMAADMRAETSSLRMEMDEMDAAAEEKKEELKSKKEKRDRRLAKNLLMSVTEHLVMEILFPSSGNS